MREVLWGHPGFRIPWWLVSSNSPFDVYIKHASTCVSLTGLTPQTPSEFFINDVLRTIRDIIRTSSDFVLGTGVPRLLRPTPDLTLPWSPVFYVIVFIISMVKSWSLTPLLSQSSFFTSVQRGLVPLPFFLNVLGPFPWLHPFPHRKDDTQWYSCVPISPIMNDIHEHQFHPLVHMYHFTNFTNDILCTNFTNIYTGFVTLSIRFNFVQFLINLY